MAHDDLASLADEVIDHPVMPLFATPGEMIDVAEAELFAVRAHQNTDLPNGLETQFQMQDKAALYTQLDEWLSGLNKISNERSSVAGLPVGVDVQQVLLPSSFAVASYRASLLPLIGDADQASLQGAAARLAGLDMQFMLNDKLVAIDDPEVSGISDSRLMFLHSDSTDNDQQE